MSGGSGSTTTLTSRFFEVKLLSLISSAWYITTSVLRSPAHQVSQRRLAPSAARHLCGRTVSRLNLLKCLHDSRLAFELRAGWQGFAFAVECRSAPLHSGFHRHCGLTAAASIKRRQPHAAMQAGRSAQQENQTPNWVGPEVILATACNFLQGSKK